ncbi:hypothetical protein [Moraxella phage Mcat6]|nr:hypothetical protein [Moraxella phage Mcat6]
MYLLHQFNSDKKPSLILATHKDAWLCCADVSFSAWVAVLIVLFACLCVQ